MIINDNKSSVSTKEFVVHFVKLNGDIKREEHIIWVTKWINLYHSIQNMYTK